MDVDGVRTTSEAPTGTATIPVEEGSGENLIVVVPGANGRVAPEDVGVAAVREADVVLLQLEIPVAAVSAAAAVCGGTVVLTPAPPQPLPAGLLDRVDVLVPNEHELAQLAGEPPREREVAELVALARRVSPRTVVVTLGARGALVVPDDGSAPLLQAPPAVVAVDTTGAGDCLSGALGQALAAGRSLPEAVRWAVTAAALSTTGPGARGALPSAAAVDAALGGTPDAVPVAGAPDASSEEAAAMSEPDRMHPEQPAEGQDVGGDADGSDTSGRTPHPEQPAEGEDVGGGESADTPG